MIGAGLQALEKHKDSAAVKDLFHTFVVTQELEQRGQHDAAIQWARTDLEVHGSVDPLRSNSSTEPLVFPLPLACHRTQ